MTIATGNEASISYGAYPYFYINGLGLSNDATTPNTKLDVGAGVTIDSTNTFQLRNQATIVIDATKNGLNGLDTGALAASTVYAVFLIADPITSNPIGAMISKSYTAPLMPFGYSAFALLGYVTTDASTHFLKGYWSDNDSASRTFTYDAFQATAITSGNSSSYANVDLTKFVPLVNNLPVMVYTNFAANAAADILALQSGNGTGDQAIIIGQVAGSSAHLASMSTVLAQTVAISTVPSPTINYKVSAGSVAVDVAGYQFTL